MFYICIIQYNSPVYRATWKNLTSLTFPDSASQVEGPSIWILNNLPGQYLRTVKFRSSLIIATVNKGTPYFSLSGGLQIENAESQRRLHGRVAWQQKQGE